MKKDTLFIDVGRDKKWTGNAVNPKLVRASSIVFDSYDEMERGRQFGVETYGRDGTSTTFAFQKAMAELDNAAGCFAYPCGTSAITSSLLSFLSAGDHLLMVDSAYSPTRNFCTQTLARLGIETTYYDPLIGEGIKNLLCDNTKVIFMESPGSLTMEVQDVPAIVEVAQQHSIVTLIDNTYATPFNFKPLDFGVDVTIQSATKYINGHSDIMLGIACANEANWPQLDQRSYALGLCASVDDLYTTLRGIRTLSVRLRQHEKNAMVVAKWLEQRPEVDHIRHPAFTTCPGHAEFVRDFNGSTGLFSFVLNKGKRRDVAAMLEGLQHFKMGFSWGGFESLVISPSNLESKRSATEWSAAGPLVRLHVGLEDPDDLIKDLENGFDRFNAHFNKES